MIIKALGIAAVLGVLFVAAMCLAIRGLVHELRQGDWGESWMDDGEVGRG
jgi:hypothetical protein